MLPLGYTWSLTAIAIVFGLVTLWGLKGLSDQRQLLAAKRQVTARLYAMRLFGDDLRLVLAAQGQLLLWNGRYLGLMLKPLIVMVLPTLFILVQLDSVYGHRALRMSEAALVSARFDDRVDLGSIDPQLDGANIEIVGAPVRIVDEHLEFWRVRAVRPGAGMIRLHIPGSVLTKQLVVDGGAYSLPARRVGTWWNWLAHPGEQLIQDRQVRWIEVAYPPATVDIMGLGAHWLVWLFVISAVTMILLKRRLGVIL